MYYSFWGACRFVQFSLNECSFSQNHPSMSARFYKIIPQ